MLNIRKRVQFGGLAGLAAIAILLAGSSKLAGAQEPRQKTFGDCEQASEALFDALEKDDQSVLLTILGPSATDIISSGDEAEDRSNRQQLVEKYKQMHRMVREPDGRITLYIGAENWPTPIQLVNKRNRWYFDAAASRNEILFRRVGKNELTTIAVCRELVDAQKEYHAELHDGDRVKQYAPRFRSDAGKHNGLYWEITTGEPESPVGMPLTLASGGDYAKETTQARPFHGYYFRILAGQRGRAAGGSKAYLVHGKMTGGFAFVAYPAEYRSSGVMTFIVNQNGFVYQKDLGARTTVLARRLTQYAPDKTWKKAD